MVGQRRDRLHSGGRYLLERGGALAHRLGRREAGQPPLLDVPADITEEELAIGAFQRIHQLLLDGPIARGRLVADEPAAGQPQTAEDPLERIPVCAIGLRQLRRVPGEGVGVEKRELPSPR